MTTQIRNRTQWFVLTLGIAATIFYFLHVIIGSMNYPGYDPLTQAVSDLTAAAAPSREIASAFTHVSGICTVALCVLLCVYYQGKVNRPFRLGVYLFAVMHGVSAVGYTLFPLSGGKTASFQDTMHIVVTALVVVLSIASMILIAVGSFKRRTQRIFGIVTLAALALMFIGSIGTGALPAYFGVAERFSVYSVTLYSAVLAVFAFAVRPREG
ncbi:MAG TPA: DUF998 domain-containing protein [Ruminococcaceae bacterium]|nr:DUF998 domain-containing protein [Oscillospiraceae bacterium]